MKPPLVPGALAERRLRPGRKRIVLAGLPLGPGYTLSPAAALDLARLLRIIRSGCDPAELRPYYRRSRNGDELLLSPWRVMHLHLIHAGSDDIVYLIQREDDVVIVLEVSDHRHLRSVPRGAGLRLDRARAAASRGRDQR